MRKLKNGYEYFRDAGREGFVGFITNPKVIQAFMTSGAFGSLSALFEVIGIVTSVGNPYPKAVQSVLSGVVFIVFLWADRNQQRFEIIVEEATDSEEDKQQELGEYTDG
jgi:hypothetical protein